MTAAMAARARADGAVAAWRNAINNLCPGAYAFVFYKDDDVWHERVCLWPVGGGKWIIRSPDGDMYMEDFASDSPGCEINAMILGEPTGELPVDLRGQAYRFIDYPSHGELKSWIRAGRIEALAVGSDGSEPNEIMDADGNLVAYRTFFPGGIVGRRVLRKQTPLAAPVGGNPVVPALPLEQLPPQEGRSRENRSDNNDGRIVLHDGEVLSDRVQRPVSRAWTVWLTTEAVPGCQVGTVDELNPVTDLVFDAVHAMSFQAGK